MDHLGHIFCGAFPLMRRICHGNDGKLRLSACRRFAIILALEDVFALREVDRPFFQRIVSEFE